MGVFTASHHELDAFPAEQLRLLQALCSHIAVAVQNARLFQKQRQENDRMSREVAEARSIQQALLPKSSPYMPGFTSLVCAFRRAQSAVIGTTSFRWMSSAGDLCWRMCQAKARRRRC